VVLAARNDLDDQLFGQSQPGAMPSQMVHHLLYRHAHEKTYG
jgi:hypothetical protein